MIEYAHTERTKDVAAPAKGAGRPGLLTAEEQESFAGTSKSSIVMVAPELLDHVREDVGKRNELMKSFLKAKEFREQMKKLEKGGKE